MKIYLDNELVCEISQTKMNVIKNDIHEEIFDEDMKRRIQHVILHKYEQCFKRLKEDWEPKIKELGVSMIPTDNDAFAELIFSLKEYKSRSQREEK